MVVTIEVNTSEISTTSTTIPMTTTETKKAASRKEKREILKLKGVVYAITFGSNPSTSK